MRVLHVFAPNFKNRFGGPIFDWKYAFSRWDNPEVSHFVLDYEKNGVVDANQAFDFEFSTSQVLIRRTNRFTWIFTLLRHLIRWRSKYDVIHFHVLWWGTLIAATWAKTHGIPTLYQAVLLDADTPSGIQQEGFGKLKLHLLKNFSMILPISEFMTQDYVDHSFSPQQVTTLMNSVDTDLFHPLNRVSERTSLRQKFGLPTDATILIFVGSIIERKGVDVLISAFQKICLTRPEAYLLMVGPDKRDDNPSVDESWIASLRQELVKAGLAQHFQFFGMVANRQTLADLYQACDIFVFPSRKEGLGNVVLEAMASGLPVVVSDLPVLRGIIRPAINGMTTPVNDIAATAATVMRLMQNPPLQKKISKAALQNMVENFSFLAWQSAITEIYRSLLQKWS